MRQQKSQIRLMQTGHQSVGISFVGQKQKQLPFLCQHSKAAESNQGVNISLLKRFQTFLMNQKLIMLSTALKKYYGRHYPIQYKQQFGFTQYWQDKKNKFEESNILQYFQFPNWYYYLFTFFILVSKFSIIWTVSVRRLYQMESENWQNILIWGLITLSLDVVLQHYLLSHYDYFREQKLWRYIQAFWKDIMLFLYFLTFPIHYFSYDRNLLFIDLATSLLLFKRCQQIKRCFKVQITATSYRNVFNITQLFTTLLPLAHVFALFLYWVAQMNMQKNWLTVRNLQELPPIQKYIYSLYFALTTMLTVGYGDISPVNIPEIILIIVIQIIGIITYGYIVNQIGHVISCMRKQDQMLSKDISTISKMAKYYEIDKNLVSKAKNYLVCQKNVHSDLTIEEEQATLSKLHDELREEISRQNSLRILKSSLFYVCNWTKRFQIQIAKKLQKKVFSPNEQIFQIPGKQRIYIFKKGKVQIHANRSSGYKKHFKKILRTIQANESLQVSDNIYGYTFIMSNTPIKLTAINKQFVAAYYVDKNDFLEIVMDSHLDREYFFEMKTKIDSASYPESWQAPLIINTKEHYIPSIQYLIRKNKTQSSKGVNQRSDRIRKRRYRSRMVNYLDLQQMQGEMAIASAHDSQFNEPLPYSTQVFMPTTRTLDNHESTWISNTLINEPVNSTFRKQNLHYMIEQGKEYTFYFKKSNRTNVLEKAENSNYIVQTKRVKTYKTLQFKGEQ